jgi:hypothetical protein
MGPSDQYGTSACAIEGESSVDRCTDVDIPPADVSKENRCKGVNIVPGAPTDQSAYCSEVAGLFGAATMVREICEFHDINAGTVYLGCDGVSTLLNCTYIDYVAKPTAPHFDLFTATRAILQQFPVKWIPHHIHGRQDDDPDAFLDRWATLDIEMDGDAKVHGAETVDKPRSRQFTIFGEPSALWLKDKHICMNLHSTLHTATCIYRVRWRRQQHDDALTRSMVDSRFWPDVCKLNWTTIPCQTIADRCILSKRSYSSLAF